MSNFGVSQLSPCKHSFHTQCIDTWLCKSNTCPLCREPSNTQIIYNININIKKYTLNKIIK